MLGMALSLVNTEIMWRGPQLLVQLRVVLHVQQGQKYEFQSGNDGKYVVLALGSGEVCYPSYMVCAIMF